MQVGEQGMMEFKHRTLIQLGLFDFNDQISGIKNILSLLPRHSVLKRAAAGEHYKAQLISANIDHVLVVCGLDGDFNYRADHCAAGLCATRAVLKRLWQMARRV